MNESPPSSAFEPISPNPYIVGNPVRDPAMFFGRTAEFELVKKRFTQSDVGLVLVFCGERRSGKTSILFQIKAGRLGPEFVPVLVDMQSMAVENQADFLYRLSQEILRAFPDDTEVKPPHLASGSHPLGVFRDFVDSLLAAHLDRKLLLMFDEYELIETKIETGVISEEVLLTLSGMMEGQRVFVLFTGSRELEKRRRDYWRVFLPKSDFRAISYLHRDDAVRLITEPVAGRMDYDDGVVEKVCRLTAGQPFYTQAICQRLVDYVNYQKDKLVTADGLAEVALDIVDNPLPQMIFLWDGFGTDEKLVLALLAQTLDGAEAFATANQVVKAIATGGYPLKKLGRARVATALENLFKAEFLLKDDRTPPGYAFRMDLWRQWVQRMHSVWQVMREEGIEVRPAPKRRMRYAAIAAVLLAAGALTWPFWRGLLDANQDVTIPPSPLLASAMTILVEPHDAVVSVNGEEIGRGNLTREVPADRDHEVTLSAEGYAETTFVVLTTNTPAVTHEVILQPLIGDVRIDSDPSGAQVSVDGEERGRTPIEIAALPVPDLHSLFLRHPEREEVRTTFQVDADELTILSYDLPARTATLLVSTAPSNAEILVDDQSRGRAPLTVRLPFGSHRVEARLQGFFPWRSPLDVDEATDRLDIVLEALPPARLTVRGDGVADIYVDGSLVRSGVQNSGLLTLDPGEHAIRIELMNGDEVVHSLDLASGEEAIYDYSLRRVISRTQGGRTP